MNAEMTVLLTAIFAACACSLVGTFLILRRMAMMADAISHAILPGLVIAYFLANGPNLVAGTLGAALAGVTHPAGGRVESVLASPDFPAAYKGDGARDRSSVRRRHCATGRASSPGPHPQGVSR